MFNINTETYLIELTRGDSASIIFGAKDAQGNNYIPVSGDELKFAVAKKVGADPIFEVANTMDGDADAFWTINIPASVTSDMKFTDYAYDDVTSDMKFTDYAYDVQLKSGSSVATIIGQTDTITPTFRVWGEVANESD